MLQHWSKPELFNVVFAIASDCKTYPWPVYSVATDLLVGSGRLHLRCRAKARSGAMTIGRYFNAAPVEKRLNVSLR